MWTLDYLEYGFPLSGTMLKVNPKLGGCNSEVNTVMLKKPTLLLGADISRPKAGLLDTEAVSIASLASNGDAKGSTYIGQARSQEPRQEIVQALTAMAGNAIRHYLRTTKLDAAKLREHGFNVIYFRDGIGEHQFDRIKEEELPQIREALKLLFATVTIVVCQKRHHTRIFPDQPKNGDRNGNSLSYLHSMTNL